eukprot:m.340261 g.340261  ORF g.340261 m.340261 type:complete len:194 (-) comp19213_c0_seq1:164-745(-)
MINEVKKELVFGLRRLSNKILSGRQSHYQGFARMRLLPLLLLVFIGMCAGSGLSDGVKTSTTTTSCNTKECSERDEEDRRSKLLFVIIAIICVVAAGFAIMCTCLCKDYRKFARNDVIPSEDSPNIPIDHNNEVPPSYDVTIAAPPSIDTNVTDTVSPPLPTNIFGTPPPIDQGTDAPPSYEDSIARMNVLNV